LRLARGEYLVLMNNDVVVTDGWLDQLIGLVNVKRGLDAQRAGHADTGASAGRPTVGLSAGSGDPRTAPSAPRVGDESGSDGAGTSGSGDRVGEAAWPTPPGPPQTEGFSTR
jgi:hypothetical protein